MMAKTIGTHSGTFHCDEALACFMLKQLPQFADAHITRTREAELLNQLDIIVDVGGVYDPARHRYDHHQIGFTETLDENHSIKLSSAGLVYKHFGREIIKNHIKEISVNELEAIFYKVYDEFIEAIDGIDNGVDRYPQEIRPRYRVHTDLSSRVGNLNPRWNDPQPNQDGQFSKAMRLAGEEFLDSIEYYFRGWLPAQSLVKEAIEKRYEIHPSGQIVCLHQYCPWRDYLFEVERELKVDPLIKYVLFGDTAGTSWRVQCVPESSSSFKNRLDLPWKGFRDDQLSEHSGIPGGIFVHISGFIGGNKTYEGTLAMAVAALQQQK